MEMVRNIFAFVLIVLLAASCASVPTIPFSRQPHDLPDGAYVDVIRWTENEATIGVRGAKVLRADVYDRSFIYHPELVQEGEWTTFKIRRDACSNFLFLDPKDGKNHFAFFTQRDNELPPKWLGSRIYITMDRGRGSCLAAKRHLR